MALACEGRNGEKCAGASRTGVVSLASSREKMKGGSGWGRGRASGGAVAGGGDFGCRISSLSNSSSSSGGDCSGR